MVKLLKTISKIVLKMIKMTKITSKKNFYSIHNPNKVFRNLQFNSQIFKISKILKFK